MNRDFLGLSWGVEDNLFPDFMGSIASNIIDIYRILTVNWLAGKDSIRWRTIDLFPDFVVYLYFCVKMFITYTFTK